MNLRALCIATSFCAFAAYAQKPQLKQPIRGLVSMGYMHYQTRAHEIPADPMLEATAHPDVYSAVVVNVTWEQLEPKRGAFDHSYIDHALNEVRAYNSKHPAHAVTAKLRIDSGRHAPDWAMALDGPPVIITDNHSDTPVPVGRYWTVNYAAAWQELQADLAKTYDANPLVQEVGISSCSTVTDEPFVPAGGPLSVKNLRAAGLTDELRSHCLMHAWEDYSAWKLTPLDFTVNPLSRFDGPTRTSDSAFTITLIHAFRAALGTRAVIGNHGLQNPLKDAIVPVYEEMKKNGGPFEMQFYSPKIDLEPSMDMAFAYHPTEIEIWHTKDAGGLAPVTYEQLKRWAATLRSDKP